MTAAESVGCRINRALGFHNDCKDNMCTHDVGDPVRLFWIR